MQIGPYNVLSEIARGGQGVVYRAQDAQGQVVALKLLLAHRAQDDQARARFLAEVHALARLRHPHVVTILDTGEDQGCPWLALDHVAGDSLEARLHQRGPLPIDAAIRLTQQLAQALSYVHACDVLHRDLKPDNVLLCGENALLTDFGLVLDEQSSIARLTATGVFQGTPGYWAPEQARGETDEHGEATDLYGLGAVLYACLTGQPPVRATALHEYMQPSRFEATPPPRELRPEVPTWLNDLCMRCLSVRPTSRPGSAAEVARSLVLAGRAGQTAAPSRRRLIVGVACVAGLAALGAWTQRVRAPGPPALAESTGSEGIQAALASQNESRHEEAKAVEEFDRALGLDPRNANAYVDRADLVARLGRYAEAIEDYDRALEIDPQNATAYANRGACRSALGSHAEAIEDYDRALEIDPRNVDAHSNRGVARERLGRYAEAIEDYDRALEIDPSYARAHANRGVSNVALGRYVEAVADYDRTLELDPRSAQAYANRGACKEKLGRYVEAIEDFDRALERDPSAARGYTNRAVAKAALGRDVEAIEDFDRAVELDPRDAQAYADRGTSKAKLGRYVEALEDLDRALEVDPRYVLAYASRGSTRVTLGRFAEAIEDFDRAVELDPRDARFYADRGTAKARLGRYVEAIEDFDLALALDPRNVSAYANRAVSKAELGRYPEAIEDFDRALELGLEAGAGERIRRARAEAVARLNGG